MTQKKCTQCSYFWCGLPKPLEHLFTVDQFPTWRSHQVWAHHDGSELISILCQRFASNTVFLSLLAATEISILFSPSAPANVIRTNLKSSDFASLGYYAGMSLCFGVFFSICALYCNFVAWSFIANIGKGNAHAILRSSIGLYASHLPQRFIVLSIYLFFFAFVCLLGILMPIKEAILMPFVFLIVMVHITSTYSAFGRIIMDTGAMRAEHVFSGVDVENLSPNDLYGALLVKVKEARQAKIPVNRLYPMEPPTTGLEIPMGDVDDQDGAREIENGILAADIMIKEE